MEPIIYCKTILIFIIFFNITNCNSVQKKFAYYEVESRLCKEDLGLRCSEKETYHVSLLILVFMVFLMTVIFLLLLDKMKRSWKEFWSLCGRETRRIVLDVMGSNTKIIAAVVTFVMIWIMLILMSTFMLFTYSTAARRLKKKNGILKGIFGLTCCVPLGMWGLGTLIDLPRPLDRYQEKDLANIPVQYDATGWPIHPETRKRSVRALPKTTEFLLNMVFFLTYPLAMLLTLFGTCCFRESSGCDNNTYQCVNTIIFDSCSKRSKGKNTDKKKENEDNHNKNTIEKEIYNDADSAEEKDTEYVLYHMHQSQQSLQG